MSSALSHVALLVPSVEKSAKFLNQKDIETEEAETFDSEGTKEVYVGAYGEQRGLLLLLEAIGPGPYQRALKKRGPSLHHIAIDVTDLEDFLEDAQDAGWNLHPESEHTLEHNTAWLFVKGVPTLIEVHQKKKLSEKPLKVSKVEIPLEEEQLELFDAIGLREVVSIGKEVTVTIDGQKFTLNEIIKA